MTGLFCLYINKHVILLGCIVSSLVFVEEADTHAPVTDSGLVLPVVGGVGP